MRKMSFLLGLIALLAIAVGCTPAGAELGIVGEWESRSGLITLEIKNDDTIKRGTTEGKIKAANTGAKYVVVKWDGIDDQDIVVYSLSLDGKELAFGGTTYNKK